MMGIEPPILGFPIRNVVNIQSCLFSQHKLKIYGLIGGTICVFKHNTYV